MKVLGKVGRGMTLLMVPSVLLFGQHGGAPGPGAGSYSGQNFGMSPIAPFRMPSSIGLAPPSFGKNSANTYPAFSPTFGAYPTRGSYPSQRGNGRYAGRRNHGGAYPFFAAPYYLPSDNGFYDAASYGDAADYGDEPLPPTAGPMPEGSELGAQVAQLSARINSLQNQLGQQQGTPGPNGQAFSPVPQTEQPTQPAPPPVTVVLNDGKSLKVQNYAVVGDTFWDLSSQPMRKIDVSKINLAASAQASEANGAEFPKIGSK